MRLKTIGTGIAMGLLVTLAGCKDLKISTDDREVTGIGETIRESRSVDLAQAQGSERVRVELELNAGELRVEGGAKQLMDADFIYNVASWKPEIQFDKSGFRSSLRVHQGGNTATIGNTKNEWRLRLNDTIPLDFSLHCGAGENRLNLGELDLRGVEVHIGAGRVELDLRGKTPQHDYPVEVHGGVGEADLLLPADAGIEARASGGLGEIDVRGLQKQGDHWRNAAAGRDKATIRVEVHGGIGRISIDAR
ncbi:MAG: toast rack family protein [Bryobacteraceae bacterium]